MQTLKTIFSRFGSDYFFATPPETQIIWFWLGFFVLLLVASLVIYFILRSRGRKEKPYKLYAKHFFWPNFIFALLGLIFIFSRYEGLSFLSYRFWVYVTVLFVIFYNAWYFMIKRNQLEDELVKFHNDERKNKWLNHSGGGKRKKN